VALFALEHSRQQPTGQGERGLEVYLDDALYLLVSLFCESDCLHCRRVVDEDVNKRQSGEGGRVVFEAAAVARVST
jgi:hypothetical protein